MPYSSNSELPDYVKKLPAVKQRQWRHVFNSCVRGGGSSEAKCFAMANGVVRKSVGEADWQPEGEVEQDEMLLTLAVKHYGEPPADEVPQPSAGDVVVPLAEPAVDTLAARPKGLLEKALSALGLPRLGACANAPLHGSGYVAGLGEAVCIVKQADGRFRWYARYSNNFQDRDGETITEEAHKEYVAWADASGVYPELWLWHTRGTRFGEADWLDYADSFTHASGLIDDTPDAVRVVDSLRGKQLGVSHGMLCVQKGKTITKYRDLEITVLPLGRASVWTTDFSILNLDKETEMGFTPEKRTFLASVLGEDRVKELESKTAETAAALKQLGVEFKSVDDAEQVEDVKETAAFKALSGQIADLTTAVSGLTGIVKAQAERIDKFEKPVEERIKERDDEDAITKLAAAIEKMAQRPTESAANVTKATTEPEADNSVNAAYELMMKGLGGAVASAPAVAPGQPAVGTVTVS